MGWSRRPTASSWTCPTATAAIVKAYPAETTEAFLDGHVSAFAFPGEACPGASSTTIPSWRWPRYWGMVSRQRTRAFTELQSHYLFDDRFGRPGKGNDKGKVEEPGGLHAGETSWYPFPSFESFEALNAYLERRCLERRCLERMDAQP